MIAKSLAYARDHPARAGTVAGWFQQACTGGVAIVLVPVLIGYLGAETAGIWFAFQGFLAFAQLSDFGFGFAISRQVAFTRGSTTHSTHSDFLAFEPGLAGVRAIATMSLRIYAFVAVIAIVAIVVGFELILPHTAMRIPAAPYREAWYLAGLAAVIALATGWPGALLTGLGQTHWVRILSGLFYLVQGGGIAACVMLGGGLTIMAAFSLVAAIFYLLASHLVYRAIMPTPTEPPERADQSSTFHSPSASSLFWIAAPVGIVNASSFLFSAVQVPLLASLLGPEKVAPFYLAQKIGQFLNRAATQSVQPQLPFFTHLLANREVAAARRNLLKGLFISLTLVGAASIVFITSPTVLKFFSSATIYPNQSTITLMAFDYFLLGCSTCITQFVLASGRNPFVYSTVIAGGLNVVLTFFLAPQIGLIALPLSTVIAGMLTNYWLAPVKGWQLLRSMR